MDVLKAANSIPPQLAHTLMGGHQAMTGQTMKQVAATMENKVALQEQATAMDAMASISGLGSKVNTVA